MKLPTADTTSESPRNRLARQSRVSYACRIFFSVTVFSMVAMSKSESEYSSRRSRESCRRAVTMTAPQSSRGMAASLAAYHHGVSGRMASLVPVLA